MMPKRTAREWAIRGAIALAALPLAYLGITHSLALTAMATDPQRAYTLAPYDGRITGRLAIQRFVENPKNSTGQLARLALQQDPTAVEAVTALGLQAQMRGDIAGARRSFAYAQRLSRRDLRTQLWAIEDAVARGDIPQALHHYDIALRTSTSATDLLFPVLSTAAADPTIRASLVATLAQRPTWQPAFVVYVASKGIDPRTAAILFTDLHRARVSVPQDATASLVNSLIATGAFDEAWRFYATIRTGVDRSRLRDPSFSGTLTTPTLFDWITFNDAGLSASIQPGPNGIFDFSAASGTSGTLLQQMQVLPPGKYILHGHSIGIDQIERSLPYWSISCQNGQEIGRVIIPSSKEKKVSFSGQFSVMGGCPIQKLTLIARSSDAVSGLTGQIDDVYIDSLSK